MNPNTNCDITHITAAPHPWAACTMVQLSVRQETRRNGLSRWSYVKDVVFEEWKEEDYGRVISPTFKLHEDEAQVLMDSLWSCGIRPTEGSGSAGSLAATERHLNDMRAIVANSLGVEMPKK
jgi:hypothetical protein